MDKCITYDEMQDSSGTPYSTYMVHNYEFIDDFDEPKLNKLGDFVLKGILCYKSSSQEKDIPLVMINHQSETASIRRSSCVSAKRPSVMPATIEWQPKVYDKDNHTLTLMVSYL